MSQVLSVGPIKEGAMSAEVGRDFVLDGWSFVVMPIGGMGRQLVENTGRCTPPTRKL